MVPHQETMVTFMDFLCQSVQKGTISGKEFIPKILNIRVTVKLKGT